ncbi:quinate 5-dehydrogenase [Fuchsiella alkaliacetigena]|uniref:quinate 5-dehydrogenase n=1 Tax=Fuchsiella alkaliacetigena TaxID=957042 RepID=UPI00200AD1BC|nr:quinate 5-dehydrogenase [Fuchsiella alkaliacetigena]MCK8824887.1 quinate 5-dehydrogenase [Fuchsiella alkaliacetigena]
MKRVVSVSLGSSTRDYSVELEVLGEKFSLERLGTDGSLKKAKKMLMELDGEVAALGLGGIDLYIRSQVKKYKLREAAKLISDVEETPVVDGSGLKISLEKRVIKSLEKDYQLNLKGKNVLLTSAADRLGMANAFEELDCNLCYGDLIFAFALPLPIKSAAKMEVLIRLLAPLVKLLPIKTIYPTGAEQETTGNKKFASYYQWADVIAGDFHLIKKYLPLDLTDKTVITNTITSAEVKLLKERGVSTLVTTTPEFRGRSFGTNLLEALLVAILDKSLAEIRTKDYLKIFDKLDFQPRVEALE